ncbi:MAG TPA: hypothetical protein VD735_03425, partial [Candidatus Saccharimonadales bacterium]|nr:hypothetical protein [Candidatus Saccharimonadales bacterium]
MHGRQVYIRADDIALVHEISAYKKLTGDRTRPPETGYVTISEVTQNAVESYTLYHTLKDGTYSGVIKRGGRYFIPETEALLQLQAIRARRALNKEGV